MTEQSGNVLALDVGSLTKFIQVKNEQQRGHQLENNVVKNGGTKKTQLPPHLTHYPHIMYSTSQYITFHPLGENVWMPSPVMDDIEVQKLHHSQGSLMAMEQPIANLEPLQVWGNLAVIKLRQPN